MATEKKSYAAVLLAGILIGGFVMFLIFLSQMDSAPSSADALSKPQGQVQDTREVRESQETALPSPKDMGLGDKSKFEFYNMLPSLEVDIDHSSDPSNQGIKQITSSIGESPAAHDKDLYYLQVGAFSEHSGADKQKAKLILNNFPTRILKASRQDKPIFRVVVGPYPEGDALEKAQRNLHALGFKPYKQSL